MSNTVAILIPPATKVKEASPNRTLLWYDVEAGEMLRFSGTRLDLKSVWDEERKTMKTVPSVVKEAREVEVRSKEESKVKRWWRQYENYNHTQAEWENTTKNSVEFEVPDGELKQFTDDLDSYGLRYEVR